MFIFFFALQCHAAEKVIFVLQPKRFGFFFHYRLILERIRRIVSSRHRRSDFD